MINNDKSGEELTKSFIKQSRKIYTNFTSDELRKVRDYLVPQLLNEESAIDFSKSDTSSEYKEKLFSLFILNGYASFIPIWNKIESKKEVTKEKKDKKEYLTKNGWKIIK